MNIMKKHYRNYLLVALVTIVLGIIAGWILPGEYSGKFPDINFGVSMQDSNNTESMQMVTSGAYKIGIQINPETPEVGENKLTLSLSDQQGNPVSGADIKAYGEMAAMGAMQAMRAPASLQETSPGMYQGPFELQMRGAWPLTVNISKSELGTARLNFDMATGRRGLQIASGGTAIDTMKNTDHTGHAAMSDHSIPTQDSNGIISSGNYKVAIRLQAEGPRVGNNELQLDVTDSAGNPVADADVRAVVQRQHKDSLTNSTMPHAHKTEMQDKETMSEAINEQPHEFLITMKQTTVGSYRGEFDLVSGGQWTLAVDIQKEKLGHGDLIFDMDTDEKGLHLATTTPEGIAYYTCSMHSSVRAAGEGQCPICSMNLIPVSNEEVTTGTITVDNRRRQLIGLETGIVKNRHLVSEIRAVGQVMYDETRLSDVSLRFDAWVGELKADYVGKQVQRGEMLFSVYSPELLAAQQEYLELLKRRSGQMSSFIKASQKRLQLWDMSARQIKQLEERGEPLDYVPIMSPRSGTVVEKKIVEGTAHKAGVTLMRIADLNQVWVEADVYESELSLIKPGMEAVITLPYMPNQSYTATVDYVYPYLMDNTRTGRIRLSLDNKDGALKPEMYAEVRLKIDLGQRLTVPEAAVLFAGDSRVVFVDLGEGKLKPRTIETGVRTRDCIEVVKGLNPGERVVTSGNFLIAAESRLKSGIEQW